MEARLSMMQRTPSNYALRRNTVRLLLALVLTSVATAAEVYAVFKSEDRGRSWVRSDSGIPGGARINAFGSLEETLFAGTNSGIFTSGDGARTWAPATGVAMSSGRIINFATQEGQVFAGTDGGGMLVSSDRGKTWNVNATFPSRKVRCLLVHEGKLYAGTDSEGVFISSDGGQLWSQLQQGLPAHSQVFALSGVGGRLFAGLYSKGLYARSGREDRWSKTGPISPLVLAAIDGTLVAGHNPGGLYWSSDLGASWSKGIAVANGHGESLPAGDSEELSSEAPVWELASHDGLVLAGASTGIYYSEDRGRTWSRARKGLPDKSPAVAFHLKRNFILAGTQITAAKIEPPAASKVIRRLAQ
jgi:photosystem II stability/assembly factor-like uncharacterized protein